MAIPTLTMIPSGYKAGTLYSVLPTNGDGDFTTTRTSSATRVNKSGLIETVLSNVPRLDYSDGSCPSLLLEPESTNYATNSNNISVWNNLTQNGSITSTANYSTAPDGTQTASRLQMSVNGSGYALKSKSTTSIIGDYVASVYLKTTSGNTQNVCAAGRGSIQDVFSVTGEWQRFEINGNATNGLSSYFNLGVYTSFAGADNPIDILAWGGQIEAGTRASSYIPTTTSAVTRNADTCFGAGNINVFNDSEGILFFKTATRYFGSSYYLSLSNGSTSNRILFRFTSTTQIRLTIISNNSSSVDQYVNVPNITQYNNYAIKYKQNDFALWVNGSEVATDTSGNTPINLSEFAFDSGNGTLPFAGNVKDVRYYNTALTDAELQELTTI